MNNKKISVLDIEKYWSEHGPISEEIMFYYKDHYFKSIRILVDPVLAYVSYKVLEHFKNIGEFIDLQEAIDYYNKLGGEEK